MAPGGGGVGHESPWSVSARGAPGIRRVRSGDVRAPLPCPTRMPPGALPVVSAEGTLSRLARLLQVQAGRPRLPRPLGGRASRRERGSSGVALLLATPSRGLVAGLVLGFAIVVMPGIAKLPDRGFLRAFQLMDGIIQDGQRLFLLVCKGSIVSVVSTLVPGPCSCRESRGPCCGSRAVSTCSPSRARRSANIPLNNGVQALELDALDDAELA